MSSFQSESDRDEDLIDEACREEFELAWMSGQRKEIEECLPECESPAYLPTLEELICIQMELQWKAMARAQSTSTVAGDIETVMILPTRVEEFVSRFPPVAPAQIQRRLVRQEYLLRQRLGDAPNVDDYRIRFPELDVDTLLSADVLQTSDGYYESAKPSETPTDLIDLSVHGYELLDRIGAGGMGVVFRARQLAADRIVALKLIRADRLHHESEEKRREILDRFRVEAQATARLEHPNVVGIFEVNVSDPDQPWFSMQYVDGQSLSERLADGPLGNREAADYTRQIADAIAAAHGEKILHRDLKPQNVFLRTESSQVLVGDFGLAKFEVDDTCRTSHEDILGTPAYMSPEQIRDSSSVTEATDIWSIGATLYHLLTGRPPFQAASAMDTLRQVLDHDPTSPRSMNPDIDRDLETICLKCLQKSPSQRYKSARALKSDLELYLSDKPITARPVSIAEQFLRWCRRNPFAATMAVSAGAALLVAIISILIGWRTAVSALAESDMSHELARDTVHDLLTEVSETVLLDRPGMQPLRRQLYERALSYYRRFVKSGRNTKELQDETGHVWFQIGRLEKELGRPVEAESALKQALAIQQRLVAGHSTVERCSELSSTWNALGGVYVGTQEWNKAGDALLRAAEIREDLVHQNPDNSELARLLANTYMNMGVVFRNRSHLVDALECFKRAEELQTSLLTDSEIAPHTLRLIRRSLGMALYNRANVGLDQESNDLNNDVLAPLSQAADLFAGLLAEQPDSYSDRRRLILCRQLQAEAESDLNTAIVAAKAAAEDMLLLINENPDVPSLVGEWIQLQTLTGRLLVEAEQDQDALSVFDNVLAAFQDAASDANPGWLRDLSIIHAEAALCVFRLSLDMADSRLERAADLLQQSLAESAGDKEIEVLLQEINAAQTALSN